MRVRWRRGPGVSLEEDARGDGEELHPALEYTTARTEEIFFCRCFQATDSEKNLIRGFVALLVMISGSHEHQRAEPSERRVREYIELRVKEQHAEQVFGQYEGWMLDEHIRRIVISTDDPRLPRIREIQERLNERDDALFFGWRLTRAYEKQEMDEAQLFRLITPSVFEPTGEQCGTVYDESSACKHVFREFDILRPDGTKSHYIDSCSVGAKQSTDLFIETRKLPKHKDIATTIAGEIVVSYRMTQILRESGLSGFELRPVRDKSERQENLSAARKHRMGEPWSQLFVTSAPVSVSPETRFGKNFFDPDAEGIYRCPYGHVAGLNLLSEVTVLAVDLDRSDVFQTKQHHGIHRNLLRPSAPILITQRFYHLLRDRKARGYKVEVAHFS